MAKPLANGFPIGAIMVRDEVAEKITPGKSAFTSMSPFDILIVHDFVRQAHTAPPLAAKSSPPV